MWGSMGRVSAWTLNLILENKPGTTLRVTQFLFPLDLLNSYSCLKIHSTVPLEILCSHRSAPKAFLFWRRWPRGVWKDSSAPPANKADGSTLPGDKWGPPQPTPDNPQTWEQMKKVLRQQNVQPAVIYKPSWSLRGGLPSFPLCKCWASSWKWTLPASPLFSKKVIEKIPIISVNG